MEEPKEKLRMLMAIPKPVKKTPKKPWEKKKKKDLGLPKSDLKKLKKKCASAWSIAIRKLYKETCAVCGKVGQFNGHHFFGKKAYPSVQFDLDNGVGLCIGCHIMKVHRKGQTEIARDALIMRIGLDRFEELKKRANSSRKFQAHELLALLDELSC